MNGELSKFEKWFIEYQRGKGNANPQPLLGMEKAILKTCMLYYATKDGEP